ncbi:uncharacterized protein LOC144711065 [Wolffia australiana]
MQENRGDEEIDGRDDLVAISDRRTLYLVNIFMGNSANFLNSFAAVCEDKLLDVHRRILRLDSSLRILEEKLGKAGEDRQIACSSLSFADPSSSDGEIRESNL